MSIHFKHIIASILLAGQLFPQAYPCNIDYDVNATEALTGGSYGTTFYFTCNPVPAVELGFAFWPQIGPFEIDSVYQEGDQVICGLSSIDTAWYQCLTALPVAGISPIQDSLSGIYWAPIDSLYEIEPTSIQIDTLQQLPVQMTGYATYDTSVVNRPFTLRAYWKDENGTTHVFPTEPQALLLPFTGSEIILNSSFSNWDYTTGENLFLSDACFSDTLTVTALVTGYHGERIPHASFMLTSAGGVILNYLLQDANEFGLAKWDVIYASDLLLPIPSDDCSLTTCEGCEYTPFTSSLSASLILPPGTSSNTLEVNLTRSGGECNECPGYTEGCQNLFAWNYSNAISDDGSCLLKGDVNADLDFNILDLTLLIELIFTPEAGGDFERWAGDLNEDDELSVLDLVMMIETIMD